VELLFIRHAEPERIAGGSGRPADPALTVRGHDQAQRLAKWLASESIDAVLASPLRRAVETAEPLASLLGRTVEIDDDLAEYDRGADHYIPTEELARTNDPRFQMMIEGRWEEFGGDDPIAFGARVRGAIDRIVASHAGRTVAAVCHGGVINRALADVVGIDRHLWFEPAYTSISRVRASRRGPRTVVTINEHAHLFAVREAP
jgi:broad specificity phosphatase PhoE